MGQFDIPASEWVTDSIPGGHSVRKIAPVSELLGGSCGGRRRGDVDTRRVCLDDDGRGAGLDATVGCANLGSADCRRVEYPVVSVGPGECILVVGNDIAVGVERRRVEL